LPASRRARAQRPQDDGDLAAVLPMLEPEPRALVVMMVERVDPGHPWLERLW
jgi:hypothetical protein